MAAANRAMANVMYLTAGITFGISCGVAAALEIANGIFDWSTGLDVITGVLCFTIFFVLKKHHGKTVVPALEAAIHEYGNARANDGLRIGSEVGADLERNTLLAEFKVKEKKRSGS